jgi:hypothetical protein
MMDLQKPVFKDSINPSFQAAHQEYGRKKFAILSEA